MSVQVSSVLAGVEPSPFQPEINQLGAVSNILNSADFRVVNTMSHLPDPCVPPDPCKDLVGTVDYGIEQFSSGTLDCSAISDAEACIATDRCAWTDAGACVAGP